MNKAKKKSLVIAELFAGVGGFRLGLEAAGHVVAFSNQWEPSTKAQHASAVYEANFGAEGHTCLDIAAVDSLPENIEMIVGGFPCQDYSVAKSASASTGIQGKKGVLWWEIQRLIRKSKPKFVFLENVDRLLKSPSAQRGRDFAIMLRTLADEGYVVEWKVINAADYGFPQRRKRVFIFATLASNTVASSSLDILKKTGVLAKAFPSAPVGIPSVFDIGQDLVSLSDDFNRQGSKSPFLSSGVFLDGKVTTVNFSADFAGEPSVLGDILIPFEQVDESFFVEESRLPEWEYLKGAKQVAREHKTTGFTYNYSEGRMAFPDSLESPSRTILTAEGGSSPSRFKHIIFQNGRYRRLTPIELERLNGFPDDWTKIDSSGKRIPDTRRAFFMGNALVVGLIERVGLVLAEFENYDS